MNDTLNALNDLNASKHLDLLVSNDGIIDARHVWSDDGLIDRVDAVSHLPLVIE